MNPPTPGTIKRTSWMPHEVEKLQELAARFKKPNSDQVDWQRMRQEAPQELYALCEGAGRTELRLSSKLSYLRGLAGTPRKINPRKGGVPVGNERALTPDRREYKREWIANKRAAQQGEPELPIPASTGPEIRFCPCCGANLVGVIKGMSLYSTLPRTS